MVTLVFPPQFQRMLKGQLNHQGIGVTLAEVLTDVCEGKPELRKMLFLSSGEVSPFVAFSVGGENVYPAMLTGSVQLRAGDTVEVILAMGGGMAKAHSGRCSDPRSLLNPNGSRSTSSAGCCARSPVGRDRELGASGELSRQCVS